MLLKDEHIYKKNTSYCELLEFGFTNNDLDEAINEYNRRNRKFGGK